MSQQVRGSRLRSTSVLVAILLIVGLALFLALRSSTGADPQSDGSAPTNGTEASVARDRTPRNQTGQQQPDSHDLTPAVAVGEDGRLLVGGPPPYEVADPETDYHYVLVISADGEEELGSVRPDHEGKFVLPEEARGRRVRLVAMTEGDAVARNHPLVVSWDEIAGSNVIFVEPRVTGQVGVRCVDDTGVGVACKFRLQRQTGHEWRTIETLESGPDGRVGLAIPGAGSYRVRLMETANRSKRFLHPPERRFTVSDATPIDVEFVVPRAAEIQARVVDESGAPLAGALVGLSIWEEGQFRAHPGSGSQISDEEGRVTISGVEPGDAYLRASRLGRLPVVRRVELVPGDNPAVFALRPGGRTVTGRVGGIPDEDVKAGRVGLHLLRLGGMAEAVSIPGVRLSQDGSFSIDGVAKGTYQLMVMPPARPVTMVWFSIDERDLELGSIDVGRVLRAGAARLRFRVDADADSMGDGPSLLYRHEAWPEGTWRREFVTFNHVHTVEDLPEGKYTLRLSPQAFDPDTWDLTDTTTVTIDGAGDSPIATLRVVRR